MRWNGIVLSAVVASAALAPRPAAAAAPYPGTGDYACAWTLPGGSGTSKIWLVTDGDSNAKYGTLHNVYPASAPLTTTVTLSEPYQAAPWRKVWRLTNGNGVTCELLVDDVAGPASRLTFNNCSNGAHQVCNRDPNAGTGFWLAIPRAVNAARGDVILSRDPGNGVIKQMLGSLGQQFTHTGMALDPFRVRHNTFDSARLGQSSSICGSIPDQHFCESVLRDGLPGLITEDWGAAFSNGSFHLAGGSVLSPINEPAWRPTLRAAADRLEWLQMYYLLYAYTDVFHTQDTSARVSGWGNQCAGSIFSAHRFAGLTDVQPVVYSASMRQQAAAVLWQGIHDYIKHELSALEDLGFDISDSTNQIVNCFALNACGDKSYRWRDQGVGSGVAVSPDNLIAAGTAGFPAAAQTSGSLGRMTTLQSFGGYYVFVEG